MHMGRNPAYINITYCNSSYLHTCTYLVHTCIHTYTPHTETHTCKHIGPTRTPPAHTQLATHAHATGLIEAPLQNVPCAHVLTHRDESNGKSCFAYSICHSFHFHHLQNLHQVEWYCDQCRCPHKQEDVILRGWVSGWECNNGEMSNLFKLWQEWW